MIKTLILFFILIFCINCPGPIINPPTDAYLSSDNEITEDPIKKDYCGDSICDLAYEDYLSCPLDCNPWCGDGICSKNWGENILNCYRDCKPKLGYGYYPKNPAYEIIDPPGD